MLEVIAVLAIAAIVMSLGFHAITGVRQNGDVRLAQATARALADGVLRFSRDHGGRPPVPGSVDWPRIERGPVHRGDAARPYVPDALQAVSSGEVGFTSADASTESASRYRIAYHVSADHRWAIVVQSRNPSSRAWRDHCYVTDDDRGNDDAFAKSRTSKGRC